MGQLVMTIRAFARFEADKQLLRPDTEVRLVPCMQGHCSSSRRFYPRCCLARVSYEHLNTPGLHPYAIAGAEIIVAIHARGIIVGRVMLLAGGVRDIMVEGRRGAEG